MNSLKKAIILLTVFALLAIYPLGNFSSIVKENYSSEADTKDGISYIQSLASGDLSQAESYVKKAEEIRNYVPKTNAQLASELLKKLENGETTYKKIFKNVCIAGDSLMKGLESYEILNKKRLVTEISASLYHLDDNRKKIVKKNPDVLILHYGLNMLGNDDASLAGFIEMYTKQIKKLKKALPETRIIVSSIFPVDRETATAKHFGRINAYNKALKKMCKKQKIEFLNNSPLFKDIEYSYNGDGIHLTKAFYKEHWLKYVIKEMEIV